jgi:hypothetical protein
LLVTFLGGVGTTAPPFFLNPMDDINENKRDLACKSIKELIDTYYPEIAERLKDGKRNGK